MLVLPHDGTEWLCQGRPADTLPNADDMCSQDSHRLVELELPATSDTERAAMEASRDAVQ
jgi:hypothetical protein